MRSGVLAALLALAPAASAQQDAPPPAPKSSADAAERLGLKFTRDAELVISSDEAEGTKSETGRESVVFNRNVRARQGDMNLECDWLEATYPATAGGRPDKILARGAVVITQGVNQARCSEASVDNVACTAECRSAGGRATLRRGGDDVEANSIYFDLCKGTVRAVGDVVIRVREQPGKAPKTAPEPAPGAKPDAEGE